MNEYIAPSKLLDTFRVPVWYRWLAWVLTALIFGLGFLFSLHMGSWLWLARSGAVVVVIPLALEASGYLDSYVRRVMVTVSGFAPEIVAVQVSSRPYMYGLNGSETDEEIKRIVDKEVNRRISDVGSIVEKRIAKNLHRLMFGIATLGTLVWGFADLLQLVWAI